ncbi:hypothetical protein [Actinospica sp.]|jgi:hypothetical protein|uniref:hypothetical protein n=1 Tax=Actinospica sp. TaxID=1872142 RepID=UPI002B983039|nr:hypothetical protein [Actinospica sp.]HWG22597.1 hypothetical protein [Actinospica sp.]
MPKSTSLAAFPGSCADQSVLVRRSWISAPPPLLVGECSVLGECREPALDVYILRDLVRVPDNLLVVLTNASARRAEPGAWLTAVDHHGTQTLAVADREADRTILRRSVRGFHGR